jgi:thiol-disulfide isomerase/thioredoxin
MTAIVILVVALIVGILVGMLFRRREGKVRTVKSVPNTAARDRRDGRNGSASDAAVAAAPRRVTAQDGADTATLLSAVGVGHAPTVLHFSADWCGQCAAVRRVIARVVQDLGPDYGDVIEVELDLDANPVLAKQLGVMTLPTTFIYDSTGAQRFRIGGVPRSADLREALATL